MAAVFPEIMTAYLGQAAISDYFVEIHRRRVDVPRHNGRWPMLQAYVVDNARDQDAGDGKPVRYANYVLVAAAKLEAGQNQDALIAEMIDALESAARDLVYNVDGVQADALLDDWTSDDNVGDKSGDRVWIEVPLMLKYRSGD